VRKIVRTLRGTWKRARWLIGFLRRKDVEHRGHLVLRYLQLRFLEAVAPNSQRPIKVLGYRLSYPSVGSMRWIFGEIFISRDYEPPPGLPVRKVVDAGANVGTATLFYKHRFPDAEVMCFEPDPRAFEYLKRNVEDNGIDGVTLHNIGLAESRRSAQLFVDPKGPGSRQSVSRDFAESVMKETEPLALNIELAPLADYVIGNVDVLKIDVEGSELAALRGAGDALERIGSIFMEYHRVPEAPLHEILGLLADAGHEYELVTPVSAKLGAVGVLRSVKPGWA
jgi:FkbM family methyltransferase